MAFAVKDPRNIKRVALSHVDDVEAELRADVLNRAQKEFGYTGNSFARGGPLAKALVDLVIRPLNTNQVQAYMKSKETTRTVSRRWMVFAALIIGPAAAIVSWLYYGPMAGFAVFDREGTLSGEGFFVCMMIALMALFGSMYFDVQQPDVLPKLRYKRMWAEYALGTDKMGTCDHRLTAYRSYVPIHILNTAVQLREVLPDVNFHVFELTETVSEIPNPLPDPFLMAQLGGERYYIGVWDEREFEAKM